MSNPLYSIRADHLRAAIEHFAQKRGMSLSELERRANLPPNALAQRARFRKTSVISVFAILTALGVSLSEFSEAVDFFASKL